MAITLNPSSLPVIPLGTASYLMDRELDMNSFKIVNLAAPVATTDAARLADTQGITIPILNSAGATVNVSLSK